MIQPIADFSYPLTGSQTDLVKALHEKAIANVGTDGGEEVKSALHDLTVQLLEKPAAEIAIKKWSCPLTCFLAIDNLRADGSFIDARLLTPKLAQWKYIFRNVAVFEADRTKDGHEQLIVDSIRLCHPRLLGTSSLGPFNTVCEMQAFASTISKHQVNAPQITWSRERDKVYYKGNCLKVDALRKGLQDMMKDVSSQMDEIENGKPIAYSIPEDLIDDMSNTSDGYTWLNGARFTDEDALLKTLLEDEELGLLQLDSAGKPTWNTIKARRILSKLSKINRMLSVLLHIVPGQPSRGTEHVDVKIRNCWRQRNLFWHDGRLWFVMQYTKTTNVTGHDMFLPIMLPENLSKLLERYLLVFRPLERVLGHVLHGKKALENYTNYLFVEDGEIPSSDDFSHTLEELTEKYFGCRLGLAGLRQVLIGYKREFVPGIYQFELMDLDEVGDLLSGHSTDMARGHYAIANGAHSNLASDQFLISAVFCSKWHDALAVGIGELPDPISHTYQLYGQRENKTRPKTTTEANVDRSTLKEMFYDVSKDVLQELLPPMLERLQRPSDGPSRQRELTKENRPLSGGGDEDQMTIDDDDFYMMPTIEPYDGVRGSSCDAATPNETGVDDYVDVDIHMASDSQGSFFLPNSTPSAPADSTSGGSSMFDPLECLRMCYGDADMTWKSREQERLITEVLKADKDIIAVIRTGGGKSAAFEVPAAVEVDKQTVLMVPFRVLAEEVLDRAPKLNIKACFWENGPWPSVELANLVILTYDKSTSDQFRT